MTYKAIFPLRNLYVNPELKSAIDKNSKIPFSSGVMLTKFDKQCLEDWSAHVDFATPQDRESMHSVEYALEYEGDDRHHSALHYIYLFFWCVRESNVQVPYKFCMDETKRWSYISYFPALYIYISRDDEDPCGVLSDWTFDLHDIEIIKNISCNFHDIVIPSLQQGHHLSLKNAINFLNSGLVDRYWNTQAILYSIGLESLFSFSSFEISHQLSENIAWFHAPQSPGERITIYNDAKKFYGFRSRIIHGDIPRNSDEEEQSTKWARKTLRESIVKILDDTEYINIYRSSNDARNHFKNLILSGNKPSS